MKSQTLIENPTQLTSYRLLVVDDDEVDCQRIERLLRLSDLTITHLLRAASLREAEEILRSESVDCAIVDLNLTDSKGVETVRSLEKACIHTALLVVTGQESDGCGVQALAGGAQDYLHKDDLTEGALTRAIRFACERKRIQTVWEESEQRDRVRQEEIRRERDFAESLIETAQAIILVLDTQGRIIRYNPYLEEISGYPQQERVGQDWFEEFIPESHRQGARDSFARTIRYSRTGGMVNPIRTHKGHLRHIEWRSRSLKDERNQTVGVLLIGQDITEKKQALDDFQRSQDRLQAVWNSILTGVALIDPKTHTVLDVNPIAEKILGKSREQLIGQICREHICCNPPGHCSVADQGEMRHCSEQMIRRADGKVISVLKSITKTTLHDQEYLIDSFIDITDRKVAEKAIRDANAKLEEAYKELKGMHSQVVQSEKLASIGQLAAGVAHEMNTPVGFVASNFDTLKSYVKKMTDLLRIYQESLADVQTGHADVEELVNRVENVRQQSKIDFILDDIQGLFEESSEGLERVTAIVQNLRDFSRIDQAEAFDSYNLNEGIQATLVVARNAIKYDADVELELGTIPPVPCCSGQINQVFLNILVNAAQAIKEQKREDRGCIVVSTQADDQFVTCRVRDDGPGIPPEVIKKVFDPFFTTKPTGKGTGLGLSVSYDIIVNKHRGELIVNSQVGQGTEFVIRLPLQQPAQEESIGSESMGGYEASS